MHNSFRNKKNTHNILYALIINAVALLVSLSAFGMDYEMMDDRVFAHLISNNCTDIIYLNIFLVRFIAIVQRFLSYISIHNYILNAYVVIHLLFAYVSTTVITKVFFDIMSKLKACCCMILLFSICAVCSFSTISFTRLAALLCIAGFLCLYHHIYREHSVFFVVLGVLLTILGSMYRYQVFLMCLGMFLAFVLMQELSFSDTVRKQDKTANSFLRFIKKTAEPKRLITGILVLVIAFSLNTISSNVLNSDAELRYYKTYTSARSSVYDYSLPDYDTFKDKYDQINIDANDLEMLSAEYMDGGGAFTLDNLNALKKLRLENDSKRSFVKIIVTMISSEVKKLFTMSSTNILVYSGICILIVYLILAKKKMKLLPIILAAAVSLIYFYLYYLGRIRFRVLYGIWLSFDIYMIYNLSKVAKSDILKKKAILFNKRKTACTAIMIAFVLLFSGVYGYLTAIGNPADDFKYWKTQNSQLMEYVAAHPDSGYALSTPTDLWDGDLDTVTILLLPKQEKPLNYHAFDTVYYRLPFYDNLKKQVFETDNMYQSLLSNDVYFVTTKYHNSHNNPEGMRKYLQKYYANGKTVTIDMVDSLDDGVIEIYKYSIK